MDKDSREERIRECIERITPPDEAAALAARKRWDSIAKPPGSLGKGEALLVKIAGIRGTAEIQIKKRALHIYCADNGVVAEGVTENGPQITAAMAGLFSEGKTSVALMCRDTGTAVFPYDVGMLTDVPGVEKRKAAYGTRNMTQGPAMSREDAAAAVLTGIETVALRKKEGYELLLSGEMGIGNTTTSAAVAAVLLGRSAAETVGRGAGLSDEGVKRKIAAIEKAVEINRPDPKDPLDVLSKVGGFDLAALTGFFLGGAACRIPVIVDGIIASAAALAAVTLCPAVQAYLLPSHLSAEPAAKLIMERLRLSPVLHGDFRLGEGTGAAALLPLLDLMVTVYREMVTFEDLRALC